MGIVEILILSISLAMDAFTISVCKGISLKELDLKKACLVGFYFGFFQALMPVLGFLLGLSFKNIFLFIDHWIIFVLLVVIGANMVYEAYCNNDNEMNEYIDLYSMFLPALATSIDAFAVGITFVFLEINILITIIIIGLITFIITSIGVFVGNKVSNINKRLAKYIGGIILIILAFKILLEHI